jgi:hypothetical protein
MCASVSCAFIKVDWNSLSNIFLILTVVVQPNNLLCTYYIFMYLLRNN